MRRGAEVLTLQGLSEEMLAPEIDGDGKGYLYLLRMDEARARDFLEQVRWPRGAVCTGCRSKDTLRMRPPAAAEGFHECRRCGGRFDVTTGIAMGRVGVPFRTWLGAVYLLCCTARRLNVFQLSRILGVEYHQARRVVQEIASATGWSRSRDHVMFYSLEAAVLKVVKS